MGIDLPDGAAAQKHPTKIEFLETLIDTVITLNTSSSPIIADVVQSSWKKSPKYRRLIADAEVEKEKRPEIEIVTEYRPRGIIFTDSYNPKILLTLKNSVVPFWEMTFKGGHERSKETPTVHSSFKKEVIEEVVGYKEIDGQKIGNFDYIPQYYGPFANFISEEKDNSDIMKRKSNNGNRIIISFLANYLIYAPREFNIFEINPVAKEEHSDARWVTLWDAEKLLKESAILGKDKDYLCFMNLVKKLNLNDTRSMPDIVGKYVKIKQS